MLTSDEPGYPEFLRARLSYRSCPLVAVIGPRHSLVPSCVDGACDDAAPSPMRHHARNQRIAQIEKTFYFQPKTRREV
jgi:hypothetical protein